MKGVTMYPGRFLTTLTAFVVGIAETVLGFRFVLKLFAANPDAPFVHWVYATSDTLLQPFRGMFPTPALDGGSVLDFSTLFAVLIYALVGYLLAELLAWLEANGRVYPHPHATHHA